MSECLHDTPMNEPCDKCCGTQGRLEKLTCHKCEELKEEVEALTENDINLRLLVESLEKLNQAYHKGREAAKAKVKELEEDRKELKNRYNDAIDGLSEAEATAQRYREALEFLETVATGENQVDVYSDTEALHWIATYIREQALTEPTKPREQDDD